MTSISELRDQLIAARGDAQTHCIPYDTAVSASNRAKSRASELRELASQAPHILGIFPGRASRVLATAAEEAEAEADEHSARASSLSSQAAETTLRVRDLERQVEAAEAAQEIEEEDEDPVFQDLDRENWRSAMAAQGVHDAVETDQITEKEAYDDLFDGWEDPEAAETAREIEVLDGETQEDFTDDDDYADAAAEARADQLAVRSLDLSIDAGDRTYEEVYTPEGHIRQHLLRQFIPEQEDPETRAPEPEPETTQPEPPNRDRGFEPDGPF